jgi:glycosyltransferase involved in cell wall biosynthesis
VKILMLASRFPWPLEKGDKLRVFHMMKALSEAHEVVLVALSDAPVSETDLDQIRSLHITPHVIPLQWWRRVLRMAWAIFSSRPFQVHWFYQSKAARDIRKIIAKEQPDRIICQMIRMSEYVKEMHEFPRTLDYMDALSAGMRRRAQHHWGPYRWVLAMEGRRLAQYEAAVFNYFDGVTIISDADRNLIAHPERKDIQIIPNGVDAALFSEPIAPLALPPHVTEDATILLFTGNMAYPPNVRAAIRLATEILPRLTDLNLHLVIAGASPVAQVRSLAADNVTVTGWLEDIRSAYQAGDLFVAPLDIGTGLQNKILEAMASGLPCITTPNVAAGLPKHKAGDDSFLRVAGDNGAWVVAIREMCGGGAEVEGLAEKGKKYVRETASWSAAASKLTTTFAS